jgi:hypothetical protein
MGVFNAPLCNYIFDEPLVLLAEDGGHFDEPERGTVVSSSPWSRWGSQTRGG